MPAPASPVLFVNAGAERGGAEVILTTLLRHLDRDRFPPHVCCLRDGPFVDELRIHNLEVAGASVDLHLVRHEQDVGINVLRREGAIRISVVK